MNAYSRRPDKPGLVPFVDMNFGQRLASKTRAWLGGYRELVPKEWGELWCCSGFDYYGRTGCGCYGITVGEYYEWCWI